MRLKRALVAVTATLSTLLIAPSPAQAVPDDIACSAVGSYSRVIGGVGFTFWLVGTTGNQRYWHAEQYLGSTAFYNRSYVVQCNGSAIVEWFDLFPNTTSPDRCNPQSTLTYKYMGARDSYPFAGAVFRSRYHYWHVLRFIPSLPVGHFVYDHSEVARC